MLKNRFQLGSAPDPAGGAYDGSTALDAFGISVRHLTRPMCPPNQFPGSAPGNNSL